MCSNSRYLFTLGDNWWAWWDALQNSGLASFDFNSSVCGSNFLAGLAVISKSKHHILSIQEPWIFSKFVKIWPHGDFPNKTSFPRLPYFGPNLIIPVFSSISKIVKVSFIPFSVFCIACFSLCISKFFSSQRIVISSVQNVLISKSGQL